MAAINAAREIDVKLNLRTPKGVRLITNTPRPYLRTPSGARRRRTTLPPLTNSTPCLRRMLKCYATADLQDARFLGFRFCNQGQS